MIRVLVFLNEITQTSIPFEIAAQVARQTEADVTVASFYDETGACLDTEVPEHLDTHLLGATSKFDLDAWKRFREELMEGHDVLHTHHNFTGSVARILAATRGQSIVNTEHRDHDSFTRLQNAVNAPTLPLTDCLVSNSHATQASLRWYETALIPDDRLRVVHNGVDLDQVTDETINGSVASGRKRNQIITVGRMVPVKNQETLLRAFRSVSERVPDSDLVLVGDGPLRTGLETFAERLGVEEWVEFTGRLPRRAVYERLSASDVFVLPSLAEGFCVAAAEAMACSVPVVASDIDVLHEVVGDGGRFVPPEDAAAFADAIVGLLSDEEARKSLGQTGRLRVEEMFTIEQTAREYYNIYQSVVKG